eukprot:3420911-Rhodomonas_salina.1
MLRIFLQDSSTPTAADNSVRLASPLPPSSLSVSLPFRLAAPAIPCKTLAGRDGPACMHFSQPHHWHHRHLHRRTGTPSIKKPAAPASHQPLVRPGVDTPVAESGSSFMIVDSMTKSFVMPVRSLNLASLWSVATRAADLTLMVVAAALTSSADAKPPTS